MGNAISTSGADNTTNTLLADIDAGTKYSSSINVDSGARLRVSSITTLGDYKTLNSNEPLLLENTGTSTGTGSLRYICAQVATEGSINESGKQRSIDTGSTAVVYAAIGTTYPVKAIRKKAAFRDSSIKITGSQLFVSSNSDIALMTVELNPAFSAALTYADVANSAAQEANGNGTITVSARGTILFSKYITQNSVFDSKVFEEDFLTWLSVKINDTSNVIAICITPLTTTITGHGAITYKDY